MTSKPANSCQQEDRKLRQDRDIDRWVGVHDGVQVLSISLDHIYSVALFEYIARRTLRYPSGLKCRLNVDYLAVLRYETKSYWLLMTCNPFMGLPKIFDI